MSDLKILFQEQGQFTASEKFKTDAKEIAEWVKKMLADEPTVKAYAFAINKESQLLKLLAAEVPTLPIEFIEEETSEVDLNKPTPNIIAGIISDENEILGFQLEPGTPVPSKFFSAYANLKKLAQCVNDK